MATPYQLLMPGPTSATVCVCVSERQEEGASTSACIRSCARAGMRERARARACVQRVCVCVCVCVCLCVCVFYGLLAWLAHLADIAMLSTGRFNVDSSTILSTRSVIWLGAPQGFNKLVKIVKARPFSRRKSAGLTRGLKLVE
jgi:hypothetical protein